VVIPEGKCLKRKKEKKKARSRGNLVANLACNPEGERRGHIHTRKKPAEEETKGRKGQEIKELQKGEKNKGEGKTSERSESKKKEGMRAKNSGTPTILDAEVLSNGNE